jgi:PAS domain S-box-containing protein
MQTLAPGLEPLDPLTALAFLCAGTTVALLVSIPRGRLARLLGRVGLVALAFLSGLGLATVLQPGLARLSGDGGMTPAHAFAFLALTVAFAMREAGVRERWGRGLAFTVIVLAMLAMLPNLFGDELHPRWLPDDGLELHELVGLVLLALALMQAGTSRKTQTRTSRWPVTGLALAALLMLLAVVASILNLQRARSMVVGLRDSREMLVHLECAENDVLALGSHLQRAPWSEQERQQAAARRAHLLGELAQVDALTSTHDEAQRQWRALRAEFESALALQAAHEEGVRRSGPHEFDAGFDRIHAGVTRLEQSSSEDWGRRSDSLMAWTGASGIATGVAAALGMFLMVLLALALHRMTRTLDSRVRRRTEELETMMEAHQEGQRRLTLAVEGTGIGFWEWNVRRNTIRWDAQMFRLYGLEPTADGVVSYASWHDAVHPEDIAAQEAQLHRTVEERGEGRREFRIHRYGDGAERILLAVEQARVGADGRTEWIIGTNLDVTEQRHQEAELRRFSAELEERVRERTSQFATASRRVQDIQRALDEHAIVDISDGEGRILYVNDRMCELSGYSREELLGQDHRILNSGVHPKEVFGELWATVLAGRIWRKDVCNRAKDGRLFWVHTTIVPVLDEAGKPHQFVVIRDDITAMIEAREQLERTNAELAIRKADLERSNVELEQFAYVASHDLQEPLRAVSGCVQMLQGRLAGRFDAESDQLLHHAVDGAGRMHALIQSLLQYSRVGTRAGDMVPIEAEAVLQTALSDLGESLRESGARVECEPLPRVVADAAQLRQVFQNLIGNAIKFRGERQPEVHVRAERRGAAWEFVVSDNGIGIAPEFRERVFEMFQRLHTREEYPGTGIGLAIVRKIVQRHGGRIWIEDTPGGGTSFHFTLRDAGERHDAT